MKRLFLSIFLLIFMLASCSIFVYLDIEAVDPVEGEIQIENSRFVFDFSKAVDPLEVEAKMIYLENGINARKALNWRENRLVVVPENKTTEDTEYKIIFPLGIEGLDDTSLSGEKVFVFSTKKQRPPTQIIEIGADNREFSTMTQFLIIESSAPLNLLSLHNNFSIEPKLEGYLSFSEDTIRYTITGDISPNTPYIVKISEKTKDAYSNYIKREFEKSFKLEQEVNEVDIESLFATKLGDFLVSTETNHLIAEPIENFPTDETFSLRFSQELDEVDYSIRISPQIEIDIEERDQRVVEFRASPQFSFNTEYTISIDFKQNHSPGNFSNRTYKIVTNYELERPPSVAAIFFQKDQASPMIELNNHDFVTAILQEFNTEASAEFYLLIRHAPTTQVPLLEIIKSLSITSQVADIKLLNILESPISDFPGFTQPQDLCIFKIETLIRNRPLSNGIIRFSLAAGYKDLLGNKAQKSYEILLFK
ncbi:MAG: Ig-like domain-containing protein [Spirochaetales bacterium]|nr:Ig-like domain-containing protein [Spirochaetales bacterium]